MIEIIARIRAERRANPESALKYPLDRQPAHVHLVFEIDHRRPCILPGDTALRRAAPDDFVGKMYVERCLALKKKPPKDWDGVWVMTSK